jgi:hypothetical protein
MKNLYTLTLLIASCLAFGQSTDPFLSAAGTTLDANGWFWHSGIQGQLTIAAGSLAYPGLPADGNKAALVAGNTQDVNQPAGASITGTAYYSAILNVPNTTGLHPNSATGDYFMMATSTSGGTGVTIFQGRLYIRTGSVENTFNLGVLNGSGGTAAPTFAATDFPVGTPVFVVVKYDLTSNTASLFVNPGIGGTEGAATVTNNTGSNAAPAQIAGIGLRQGGNGTAGTGNVEIDLVRIADNWGFVTSGTLRTNQNGINGLSVYPNPVTNGNLYITSDSNEIKNVIIYDILGKKVVNTNVTDQAVNVSPLNSGVYIVKITEAGKTATRKLIIK